MLLIALMIHLIMGGLSYAFGGTTNLWQPSLQATTMIGIMWLAILLGCFMRMLDVRAGGAVLARRFGAVHASDRSRHAHEKRLLNVVAEMSIAASCPQPDVFVLRNESGINAFVVGAIEGGQAIVVSQGALDTLDRDELQAVVAHEFGHIVQDDLPLNMRLLIVLGGLHAITEIGHLLTGKDPDELAHPGVLVGFLLRGVGSVGVGFGTLLRAAFSRQREYLADATAVQFTRNPQGLASALACIRDASEPMPLQTPYSQELAHMCFHMGNLLPWYQRLFASHPPLQARIDAIDPHFAVKRRNKKKQEESVSTQSSWGQGAAAYNTPVFSMDNVNSSGLSDRIVLLLPDDSSCLAAIFSVFASDDASARKEYLSAIAFAYNQRFSDRVKELLSVMQDELRNDQISVIEHATSHLREKVKFDNRLRLLMNLEKLLVLEGEYSLMNYATLQLIRRNLDAEFPVLENRVGGDTALADQRRVKTFDAMGQEFALLLSLMVESSGAPAQKLDSEFQRVLRCYTQTAHPRRTGKEPGIIAELEAAFQTLYVQPQPIRQAFVQHCVEIMQGDGHVARAEQALLDLFAASLGCQFAVAA